MATIPGARYFCVADGVTGDVLAEQGPSDPDRGAALRWGALLPEVLRSAGDVEDVMITAERTYHLLRRVRDGPRVLLVHVSVDRERGTLAAARRTLVTLDLGRPATLSAGVSSGRGVVPGLPVRTPRRPDPAMPPRAPGAAAAPGSPLSAVPPPRSPAPGGGPVTAGTSPPDPPVTAPPVRAPVIPQARGWSDDLYTMRRLLDGLRKLP